jgi:hypothetical protein
MVLANIHQEIVNRPSNIDARSLDSGDDLRADLNTGHCIFPTHTYLRDDIQPRVDLHCRKAIAHRMADILMGSVLEPEGEQPQ